MTRACVLARYLCRLAVWSPFAFLPVSYPPVLAGAAQEVQSAKPLSGNKPCPYPSEAQRQQVAGLVRFVVQVRPDGTAESVEVLKVPLPDLGFQDAVRACVSGWRFAPAPAGEDSLRRYEGELRFRLAADEEVAIRTLLERLATAWNADDMKAVEDLSLRPDDAPGIPPPEVVRSLGAQLQAERAATWRMELEPEVEHIRFLRPDVVSLTQPYRRVVAGSSGGTAEMATIDAVAVKGSRGWRFAIVSPMKTVALEPIRVGRRIPEPRKVKDAIPRYPELAKDQRRQGVVILECVVSPEGKVTDVKVLRGIPLLDGAAIEAVRHWEYTPTILDGRAVPVIMTVTVNFKLR